MPTGGSRILRLAEAHGSTVCFANPGTTELPIVQALEEHPGVRPVLCLFEGVCTGAADGFARVTGRPALTLTHLGPGFANGMANLHNARRAHSPIVNLVGDHPAHHLPFDSPLTSDIAAMAGAVSDWAATTSLDSLTRDVDSAFRAATSNPGQVSTLIVPVDVQATVLRTEDHPDLASLDDGQLSVSPWTAQVGDAAKLLSSPRAVLYLGGTALRKRALLAADRIRTATGCRVITETFAACQDRGLDVPRFSPLPYFPEAAAKVLDGTGALVSVGAPEPVSIFSTVGTPSRLAPADAVRMSFGPGTGVDLLEAIAEAAGAPSSAELPAPPPLAWEIRDEVSAESVGAIVAASIEENSIVVQEAATNGYGYERSAGSAKPHLSLALTGGAIGIGLPLAVGAGIGRPGQRVIALQADGSAMYTNQALWTMVREGLDVTVVLLSNARYAILQAELQRIGSTGLGGVERSLTTLTEPRIRWVDLAHSMGMGASRCRTNAEFQAALLRSIETPGPSLIEVELGR